MAFRKMLRVLYLNRTVNEEVLEKIRTMSSLVYEVRKREATFF